MRSSRGAPVTPERWTKIDALFLATVQIPHADRAAWLERECAGDTELRDEVLSLLRYDTAGPISLHTASLDALQSGAASMLREESLAGIRLGPWRVEKEIGRGGMSVVYLAVRAEGDFSKQSAIKLIKRGMDTDAVVERLRRERRILAALDHPYIARLLDGGATPEGAPYLVMDYVEGLPIDAWCEQHALTVGQRCDLMAKVCDAVAYAHRMLVIHRDLKPGNIFVGEDGNPRLLDFGIARVLSGEIDPGAPPETRAEMRCFTPEYASPECIAGKTVGTAADVYSLGVVLFELLTGARPESTHPEKASATALRNGKQEYAKQLRGDLDNILQKALSPEPEERYTGAGALADDLRCYRSGMPVTAGKPGLLYRGRKFLRRHRTATATAFALSAFAALGLGLYIREVRLAANRFEELHHFASSFLFDVDDQLRDSPDTTSARHVVAGKALAYLNSLAVENSGDRQLRREAGNAWTRLGDLQGDPNRASLGDSASARKSYQKAISILEPLAASETGNRQPGDIRSDLITAYAQLAQLERIAGNTAVAASLMEKVLPVSKLSGNPPDPKLQEERGDVLIEYSWLLHVRGKLADASATAAEAVSLLASSSHRYSRYRENYADALSALAVMEHAQGEYPRAAEHLRGNLVIRQVLVGENPRSRPALRNLILAWGHLGDLEVDRAAGKYRDIPASLSSYAQMEAAARAMAASDPSDRTARMDLGICLQRMAAALVAAGRSVEAIEKLENAVAIFADLEKLDPANRRSTEYKAFIEGTLGAEQLKLGQVAAGRAALMKGIATVEILRKQEPDSISYTTWLLRQSEDLAGSYAETGDRAQALQLIGRIDAVANEWASRPALAHDRVSVPEVWGKIGDIMEKLEDPAAAKRWYRRSLDGWAAIGTLSPDQIKTRDRIAARLQDTN